MSVTRKIAPLLFPLSIKFPNAGLVVKVHDQYKNDEVRGLVEAPCEIDADFFVQSHLRRSDPLFVPKLYAALSHFTRADDGSFDPWKGSFGFRFLLRVEKNGISSSFIHRVFQYRQGFRAPLYHLVPTSQAPQEVFDGYAVMQGPPDELFSKSDFEAYSYRFFESLLDKVVTTGYTPDPFLITAASEGLVAGFDDGEYFERYVDEKDDFDQVADALRKKFLKEKKKMRPRKKMQRKTGMNREDGHEVV
jgi:hypothetical protein